MVSIVGAEARVGVGVGRARVQDLMSHQDLELSRASSAADAHVLRRKVRPRVHGYVPPNTNTHRGGCARGPVSPMLLLLLTLACAKSGSR
jgi:hypothetical protein